MSTMNKLTWIGDPPAYHTTPDGEVFVENAVDDTKADVVDDLVCHRCQTAIGWWADVDDDTGRNIGGFIAYGVSADRRRRWCEDCFPGEAWPEVDGFGVPV